jgi:tRNA (guanine-N7-)-methyltransferase
MGILDAPPTPKAGSLGRRPISRTSSERPSEISHPGIPQRRKLYGRRKGPSLSAHQTGLIEHLLPRLALVPEPARAAQTYFPGEVAEVWLEIGFGAGEHLAWQAETHPGVGIIGVEPYVAGQAKLLSRIADKGLGNLRLYAEDARDVIAALPDASLARVFILFPDPWPKTRHHKRRFIQMDMLDRLARVMKPGAELRFATDDHSYLLWALERIGAHPAFHWLAQSAADWRTRTADWPQTRYEAKAIAAARVCTYLRFKRV